MRDRTYYYLIIANLLLISYYLSILYLTDLGFVFSKLDDDPFNYFVMTKSLAETGSTDVRVVEEEVIIYTPIPAYIRFPLFLLFKDLDTRLRAIQVFNIILLTIVANIYWIYLRKTIPVTWHKAVTFLPFIYLCFNPWFANVYMPLSDLIFALLFFSIIVVIKTIDTEKISLCRLFLVTIMLGIFIWSIFLIKFTSASLIAFMIIYFMQNNDNYQGARKSKIVKISIIIISVAVIVIILLTNIYLIMFYFKAGVNIIGLSVHRTGHVFIESMANLLFSAVPAQIVPNYIFFYDSLSKITLGLELSQISLSNSLFLIIGLVISVITGAGIWRSRRLMGPEIGCLLVMLPVLMIPTNSTARYLSVIQPFFWIFFIQGITVLKPLIKEKSRKIFIIMIGLFIFIIIATQYRYIRKISNYTISGIRPVMMLTFMEKISKTYKTTKKFIDSLPKERTRFVSSSNLKTKWYAISNIKYITYNNIGQKLKEGYDIYVVVDCTRKLCNSRMANAHLLLEELANSQGIGNCLVFSQENSEAKSFIYKLFLGQNGNHE